MKQRTLIMTEPRGVGYLVIVLDQVGSLDWEQAFGPGMQTQQTERCDGVIFFFLLVCF